MRTEIPVEEINKWLGKIEEILPDVKGNDNRAEEFLKNINAYAFDCRHFLEKGDLVNSFEAIIYAWGWLEAGWAAGILEKP